MSNRPIGHKIHKIMANTIRGKILAIEKIQEIPSKKGGNPYHTRRLLLDATRFDGLTGERGADNFVMLDFGGEQDVHVPDNFKKGDLVEVSFRVRGIKYTKKDTNKSDYFVHLAGYRIEYVNRNENAAQNGQQGNVPQNQGQQPAPQQNGAAPSNQGDAEENLPF